MKKKDKGGVTFDLRAFELKTFLDLEVNQLCLYLATRYYKTR